MRVRAPDAVRTLTLYTGVAALAVILGLLVARGHVYMAVAVVIGCSAALILVMRTLETSALTWWLPLGVVAYPFVRYPSGHSQLTFDRFWVLGLAGALAVSAGVAAHRSRASRRLAGWIIVFAAALLLRGLLTSSTRTYAIGLGFDSGVLPAIFFLAARRLITDSARWDRLLASFLVAGCLLGIIATGERALGFQLATLSGGDVTAGPDVGVRVSGPYASDDVLAVALLTCLAATILWIQLDRRRLAVGMLVVLLELAGITFTFFRGAWIATLVVIVVGTGLRPRRFGRLLGTVALVAVIAGVALLRVSDTKGLAQRLNNTQNVSGRVATYQQAVQLFSRHPISGVGLGQFAAAQRQELPANAFAGVGAVSFAHNSYFGVLAEGGLLVLLPFAGCTVAVVLFVRRFRKVSASSPRDVLMGAMITAAALAYLLMSLEETVIVSSTESNAFLAILLGACAARLDQLESIGRARPAVRAEVSA